MAELPDAGEEPQLPAPPAGRGVARNTAIFSIVTGVSRIVGLLREIVAASFFGTGGPASAFTLAFQVPNLFANLFANAALSAAFVPVFTELLQKGRKKEAFRLASTLFWIMLIALGAVTAFFILAAGTIMPLFIGDTFKPELTSLLVGLSQILFPVVLILGLTGILVAILQSYDHFTIPAISPAVWNVVIIVLLVILRPHYPGGYEDGNQLHAYAIAVLVATFVQLLLAIVALGRIDFRLQLHIDWHDPRIKQVFTLMLPVTIGLGIVNLDQLINSVVRHARLRRSAAGDRQRVSRVHAAAGPVQRRRGDGAVPDAQSDGGEPRRALDAPGGRQRDAPDQPAADPGGGVHGRAAEPDRAAAVPARQLQRRIRRTSSRSRCSGLPSACRSAG